MDVALTLDKYKNILYNTFHPAGTELFGSYLTNDIAETLTITDRMKTIAALPCTCPHCKSDYSKYAPKKKKFSLFNFILFNYINKTCIGKNLLHML